mgnify:CR=1 FL=1
MRDSLLDNGDVKVGNLEKPQTLKHTPGTKEDILEKIKRTASKIHETEDKLKEKERRLQELKKELEKVVEVSINLLEFDEIVRRGYINDGTFTGKLVKVTETFGSRGIFIQSEEVKKDADTCLMKELWLLLDGSFVEMEYYAKSSKKGDKLVFVYRAISENLVDLDHWGVKGILSKIDEKLNEKLVKLEKSLDVE